MTETIIQKLTDLAPQWLIDACRSFSGADRSNPLIPEDLEVIQNGLEWVPGKDEMDYLWYQVREREHGHDYIGYRVVRLLQLRFLPLDARADAGLLQKTRTVLKSLYGADVSFLYLAAGIFSDPPIGILQCYGVSFFSPDKDTAIRESRNRLATLRSALTGAFRQLHLEPLSVRPASWIFSSFHEMPHALVVVGQPDPRENARGGNQALFRDPLTDSSGLAQQYTQQQNEILFRGMSHLKEDFLFLVLTSPIDLGDITRMLVGLAEETSTWAAWQQGVRGVSFGISLPAMLSGALAQNAAQGYGTNEGQSHTDGTAHGTGTAHSVGTAHTEGHATTSGWAHTISTSSSQSSGASQASGIAASTGLSTTDGASHTEGSAHSDGTAHSEGTSEMSSHTSGENFGLSGGLKADLGFLGTGVSGNVGANGGWSWADSAGSGSSVSDTTSHMDTTSVADSQMHSSSVSQGLTASSSASKSTSESSGVTESWSHSGATTNSVADTTSKSDTTSQSDTSSKADSTMQGSALSQMVGRGASTGLSVGIAPSMSLSNSYQWQFDPAILITQILRMQQGLLSNASKEGAYYTDVYAFARTEQGKQALMGLIPESFHGTEDVVTGVQIRDLTADEQGYIARHAQAFSPSTRVETVPEVLSGYMDSTILTMLQLAAYTAPGAYEMGSAMTVQEATPDFAFYPETAGEVILGKQWSSELGEITSTLLRLPRDRHFHTVFCGDTGFGKSVAAERLAYESTGRWHYRTIVLDFGQGWRRAVRWPGLEGRVDVRQLYPGAQRPLRWNLLQVPRRMDAGRYRSLLAELFANAGRMGPRQLGFIRRALTEVYSSFGVLTTDTTVQRHETYGWVASRQEADEIQDWRDRLQIPGHVSVHTQLVDLLPSDLQALAVLRSKVADISELIRKLRGYYDKLKNDQASRTSLEGVLLRLEQFGEGQMARQYGAGMDSLPIEDLGLLGATQDPWGIAVIEGGAEMDEYPKAAILSLLASVLYLDAVVRRREALSGMRFPPMQIFFEEANKILSGVSASAASDQGSSSGSSGPVSEIFQTMWRDGRKYQIFLHLMVQTVSELPAGILPSCNNMFAVQTKNPTDRDLVMTHIGRSEKGFVNTEYKRYLARIPRGMSIVKLGYSDDVTQIEPILLHPLMVPGTEPSDSEILSLLRGS